MRYGGTTSTAAGRAAIRATGAVALPAGSGAVAGRSVAGSAASASQPKHQNIHVNKCAKVDKDVHIRVLYPCKHTQPSKI